MIELNIKPWCNCILRGTWARHDGFTLDAPSGLWVHPRCRKPSKMNYERNVLGLDPIPQKSYIVQDIFEYERIDDLRKWARGIIEEELDWDLDDLD